MQKVILFVLSGLVWVSCSQISHDKNQESHESWEALRSEPSFTLEPNEETNVINYNLFIKDNRNKSKKSGENLTDDLIFDQGNLTLHNAVLDMTSKYSIRFIDVSGKIIMEKSKLTTSFIENASVEIMSDSELHLYNNKPLINSGLNILGENVSIFFHGITFEKIYKYVFESGIISINNRKMLNSSDIDSFPEKQIGIKSFRGGVCLTIN